MLAQGQIILNGAAQQPSLRIQVAEVSIDVDLGGIDLENFFIGGNGLEDRPFGAEGAGGLKKGGDGVGRGIAFQLEVADGVENRPVGRGIGGEFSPFGDGSFVLPLGGKELRVLENCSAIDSQEDSSPDVESQR